MSCEGRTHSGFSVRSQLGLRTRREAGRALTEEEERDGSDFCTQSAATTPRRGPRPSDDRCPLRRGIPWPGPPHGGGRGHHGHGFVRHYLHRDIVDFGLVGSVLDPFVDVGHPGLGLLEPERGHEQPWKLRPASAPWVRTSTWWSWADPCR